MRKFENAKELLNREYPLSIRSKFVPIIKRAYSAVAQLKRENEILNWSVADNLTGHLRNVAVEFEFKRMIDNNQLPLRYHILPNKRRNHKHIELITSNSVATISHLNNKYKTPRKAVFRTNLSLINQLMFDVLNDSIDIVDSPYYILITHGGRGDSLDFVTLGVPEPYVNGWIYYIDLKSEFQQISHPVEEEIVEEETIVELKEYLKQEVVNSATKELYSS